MTQKLQVLNHLQKNKLTPLVALRNYGTLRLADIVFELRSEGYNIVTNNVNVGTKKKAKYVAEYQLNKNK